MQDYNSQAQKVHGSIQKNKQQWIKVPVIHRGPNVFNKKTTIQDLPSQSMPFQFVKQQPFHNAAITALMKSAYWAIQWKEEHVISEEATNQVYNILTDNRFQSYTGMIRLQMCSKESYAHSIHINCTTFLTIFNNYKSNNHVQRGSQ